MINHTMGKINSTSKTCGTKELKFKSADSHEDQKNKCAAEVAKGIMAKIFPKLAKSREEGLNKH